MTAWRPDARDRQGYEAARVLDGGNPGWAVTYGPWSRMLFAFGAPDGRPIAAETAAELLARMRAAGKGLPSTGANLPQKPHRA